MNPAELRALADALEPMAKAPRFEDFDVPAFCAWVRACADAEPVARIYTDAEMVHRDERWGRVQWIEPESELAEGTLLYTHPAPAAPQAEPCIGNDSACPCQDGDACHYKDAADGTKAWPVPQAEPKREPLPGLAPTHRCPACGALWRQCDDASWNLRSASCCGLCDAGRVELVRLLDEPKREPSCLWSRADDDTDVWETKCGHAFMIIDGTPTDNQMAFCCYCGRPLEQEIGGSDE